MYTNLKLQIWKSGLRQNRIAQLLGMHETVLSKIVNGFREPSDTVRASLAAVLHSDEEWLFHWEEDGTGGALTRLETSDRIGQPALDGKPDVHGVQPSDSGGLR